MKEAMAIFGREVKAKSGMNATLELLPAPFHNLSEIVINDTIELGGLKGKLYREGGRVVAIEIEERKLYITRDHEAGNKNKRILAALKNIYREGRSRYANITTTMFVRIDRTLSKADIETFISSDLNEDRLLFRGVDGDEYQYSPERIGKKYPYLGEHRNNYEHCRSCGTSTI